MNTTLPQLDGTLLLALIPVAVLVLALVLWALIDIVRRPQTAHLPKSRLGTACDPRDAIWSGDLPTHRPQ